MSIVFVEYKIIEAKRAIYLNKAAELMQTFPAAKVYEGTDQPGLFVEIWDGMEEEQFHAWKQVRISGSMPLWREINACIKGGADRLHIWRFSSLPKQ